MIQSINELAEGSQFRPPTAAGGSKKRPCKRTPKKGCRVIDMRKPTERLSLPLETIEDYCINCVTWEEAKPFVDLLELFYGQDAPPKVKAIIRRIKKNFRKLIYPKSVRCKTFINQGPLFHIEGNENVNL